MAHEASDLSWLVVKVSSWSVEETVARLSDAIVSRGAKLFAVIDHSGEARASGLELRDTKVLIFGSPVAGTPVMESAPLAALDLPLKVLVFDEGGATRVCYASPSGLADRYGLASELVSKLGAIDAITDAALERG
jgi:uncharacterized protein (DUF302 family)